MEKIDEKARLRHLGDVEVEAVVEMGRKKMKLGRAQRLREDDVLELDILAGEAFAVIVNGVPFARGETVALGERMAFRLTRMMAPVTDGERNHE